MSAASPSRLSRPGRVALEQRIQVVIMLAIGSAAGAASFTHVHNVAAAHAQAGWLAWADAVVLELMSIASGPELRRKQHQIEFWEDTSRIPVEDRLEAILARIQQSTEIVVRRREADRRRLEEARARYEEERRQRDRLDKYDAWRNTLLELNKRRKQHHELSALIADLERAEPDQSGLHHEHLHAFLSWAKNHLEESDPLRHLRIPGGEIPEMTYDEWVRWTIYFQQRTTRPYP